MGASKEAAGAQDAELAGLAEQLVDAARTDGVALTGPGGLLTGLVQRVLQASLETELSDHLGYERHAVEGRRSGNSRNGHFPKTVRTEVGDVQIKVPRDRNGTFEPVTVPKGVRHLEGLDAMVVSLYGKGMTTGDIRAHHRHPARGQVGLVLGDRPADLAEIYGQDISGDTISRITDSIVEDMNSWQSHSPRPG